MDNQEYFDLIYRDLIYRLATLVAVHREPASRERVVEWLDTLEEIAEPVSRRETIKAMEPATRMRVIEQALEAAKRFQFWTKLPWSIHIAKVQVGRPSATLSESVNEFYARQVAVWLYERGRWSGRTPIAIHDPATTYTRAINRLGISDAEDYEFLTPDSETTLSDLVRAYALLQSSHSELEERLEELRASLDGLLHEFSGMTAEQIGEALLRWAENQKAQPGNGFFMPHYFIGKAAAAATDLWAAKYKTVDDPA